MRAVLETYYYQFWVFFIFFLKGTSILKFETSQNKIVDPQLGSEGVIIFQVDL